jgi:predicted MFS family arabinose efflux permease
MAVRRRLHSAWTASEPLMTKGARYRLLAVVYGSQFIPLAFFLYGLTAILREREVALERIALLQLLALVWVVKFTWAPLVDRYGSHRLGHYRGWLLAVQALLVGVILLLVPLDVVKDLPLLLGLVGAVAVLSATHDIAADATAVRLLQPAERGVGNGIQRAGGYLGLMVGGGGVLIIYDRFGWGPALAVLAVLTVLPLPVLLRWREYQTLPGVPRLAASFGALGSFFGRPGAVRWALVVLPLYYLGIATAYPLLTPMLVDAGWPLDRIGAVSIMGGGTASVLASLASGVLVTRLGRRQALAAFGLLQVAAITALLPVARGEGGTLTVLGAVVLLNVAYATVGTAVYTVNMDWSRAGSAGSDFTVQDSLVHLCSQLAGATALGLAGFLGYSRMLALSVVLGLAGVVAAVWLFHDRPLPPVASDPRDPSRPGMAMVVADPMSAASSGDSTASPPDGHGRRRASRSPRWPLT